MSRRSPFLLLTILVVGVAWGGHWELELIDPAKRNRMVQIQQDSSGHLYVCYDTAGTAQFTGVVRVAIRDSAGWHPEDISQGILGGGSPRFSLGPHGEMCAACFDTTRRYWLVEQTDTGWIRTVFPVEDAGNLSVVYDTAGRLHAGYLHQSPGDYWVGKRTDSGWTAQKIFSASGHGWYVFSNHCFEISPANRSWYLAAFYWEMSIHIWGSTMALLRGTDAVWDTVWRSDYVGRTAVALATCGDTAGFCQYPGPSGNYLHYGDELVDPIWYWQDAGMAYDTCRVPHLAYLSGPWSGPVRYAFRTNRWHIDTVPGSGDAVYTDLVLDSLGQPVIAFCTNDSGVWLARGIDVVGVETQPRPEKSPRLPLPTLARGNLFLPRYLSPNPLSRPSLLDISGRRVMALRPGNNDIRHVVPGVYFVREEGSRIEPSDGTCEDAEQGSEGPSVRKVVIQR